ncbi:MAG: hypothetical protein ACE14S_11710 [Candidatus Bathyarchaeia archaeon]
MTNKKKSKEAKQAMNRDMLAKASLYKLDLTTIEGDGSFPCPKCGTSISPEDETEDVYQIVDTKVVNDELVELDIVCGTCGSRIKLTGFQQTVEGLATE